VDLLLSPEILVVKLYKGLGSDNKGSSPNLQFRR